MSRTILTRPSNLSKKASSLLQIMSYNSHNVSCMAIYMSDSTPYNEVEVMYSEQSS